MNSSRKVVFVGGIHGVGKTTFCNQYSKDIELEHYSCSEIIKKTKDGVVASNTKSVNNVKSNQDVLVRGLELLELNNKSLVLDGHFVLLQKGIITRVPSTTFADLEITETILLTDSENRIYDRINKRDQTNTLTEQMLREMQEEEIKYAHEIATNLDIPIEIISVSEIN